ncbi:MAG: integrase, partial [Methanosphaera sp. rholeuAM270]
DNGIRALILFMSSSGTAKAETLSITIEMFIKGLREYTQETDTLRIVEELKGRNDIVPILYLRRIKTDKYYYTCCSPEATHHILQYLYYRLTVP